MNDSEWQELPVVIFEDAPLYSKIEWQAEKTYNRTKTPSVHLYCGNCKCDRTFTTAGMHGTTDVNGNLATEVIAFWYRCAYCKDSKYAFLLRVSEDNKYLMKVGQYPPPDISIGKYLSKVLGEYENLYNKGLTCEGFGYGIAAYAYYRRIVELILDRLLAIVEEVLPQESRDSYANALNRVRDSRVAEEKIRLVKDLLPNSLRPDGINPLDIIYDVLSKGLHSLSDEDCLIIATQVRSAITFIVEKIENEKHVTREFTESMRGLLERKNPRSGRVAERDRSRSAP